MRTPGRPAAQPPGRPHACMNNSGWPVAMEVAQFISARPTLGGAGQSDEAPTFSRAPNWPGAPAARNSISSAAALGRAAMCQAGATRRRQVEIWGPWSVVCLHNRLARPFFVVVGAREPTPSSRQASAKPPGRPRCTRLTLHPVYLRPPEPHTPTQHQRRRTVRPDRREGQLHGKGRGQPYQADT